MSDHSKGEDGGAVSFCRLVHICHVAMSSLHPLALAMCMDAHGAIFVWSIQTVPAQVFCLYLREGTGSSDNSK
jgi:hypothetical protein